jgi:hypothetical protein
MTFQTSAHIMMVRPANFGFNPETAVNNAFQNTSVGLSNDELKLIAIKEFDNFVAKLQSHGVHVYVMQDGELPPKPDAVFPNNWISFHDDGSIITYPMFAPLRRLERDYRFVETLNDTFLITHKYHLEYYEEQDVYLEGTGSMIFDRPNKIVYACLSPRTDERLLDRFCEITGYEKVVFNSVDGEGQDIYHTNVMMAIGESFVVICMDTIRDEDEKQTLLNIFQNTNKEIIDITLDQMMQFAGNMLQVRNDAGDTFLVMSLTALQSLNTIQIHKIESYTKILAVDITNIETIGGGSARCMMAEVFLPIK